jgi:hypothetical protein
MSAIAHRSFWQYPIRAKLVNEQDLGAIKTAHLDRKISHELLPEGHAGAVVSLKNFTVCSLMLALGRKWP